MWSLMGPRTLIVEVAEARHHVGLDQPLGFVAALRMLLYSWMRNERVRGGKRLDQLCRNRLHRSGTPVFSLPFAAKKPAPAGGTERSDDGFRGRTMRAA